MEAGEPGPGGRAGSSADSLAEEEEEDEDEESAGSGRSSRTSSLVSGLLTELYSAAEAAAPSSGSARSRVLQELQQRPSQVKYLRLKDVDELTTIKRELNYRISVQSSKLLCLLKQKDRLVHQVQKNCDIVTACLQAVSQKRCFSDENIYLQYNVTCHKALVRAFMYSINIMISCNTKIFIKKKGAGFAV